LINLQKLYIVDTLLERKAKMFSLSDAFIVLPGGLGTLEEIFEIWNTRKIGLHTKSIGLLNINGYFDKLLDFLSDCQSQGFISHEQLALITVSDSSEALLQQIFKH